MLLRKTKPSEQRSLPSRAQADSAPSVDISRADPCVKPDVRDQHQQHDTRCTLEDPAQCRATSYGPDYGHSGRSRDSLDRFREAAQREVLPAGHPRVSGLGVLVSEPLSGQSQERASPHCALHRAVDGSSRAGRVGSNDGSERTIPRGTQAPSSAEGQDNGQVQHQSAPQGVSDQASHSRQLGSPRGPIPGCECSPDSDAPGGGGPQPDLEPCAAAEWPSRQLKAGDSDTHALFQQAAQAHTLQIAQEATHHQLLAEHAGFEEDFGLDVLDQDLECDNWVEKEMLEAFSAQRFAQQPRDSQVAVLEVYTDVDCTLAGRASTCAGKVLRFSRALGDLNTATGRTILYGILASARPQQIFLHMLCRPGKEASSHVHSLLAVALFRHQMCQGRHFHVKVSRSEQLWLQAPIFAELHQGLLPMCLTQPPSIDSTCGASIPTKGAVASLPPPLLLTSCRGLLRDLDVRFRGFRLPSTPDLMQHLAEVLCGPTSTTNHGTTTFLLTDFRPVLVESAVEGQLQHSPFLQRMIKRRRLIGKQSPPTSADSDISQECQNLLHVLQQNMPQFGKLILTEGPIFDRAQAAFPEVSLRVIEVARGIQRRRPAPIAFLPGESPLRRSFYIHRSLGNAAVDDQWQHWETLTKRFLQAPCDPARVMVTMFGKIPHTTPEDPSQPIPVPASAAATDYWQQVGRQLIRVHQVPRTQLFVPAEVPSGINPDNLEPVRTTYAQYQRQSASNPERFVDRWIGPTSHHELPQMWTRRSVFVITKRGLKALSGPSKKLRLIAPPAPSTDQSSHPVQQSPQVEVSSSTASVQTARHGPKVLRLEPEERAWLLRVHKNLGHPDVKKLQVFLRECKFSGAIVEAVEELHCPTCHELQKPKIGRPAAIHPVREFGERVAIDGVTWTSAKGVQMRAPTTMLEQFPRTRMLTLLCRPLNLCGSHGPDPWLSYSLTPGLSSTLLLLAISYRVMAYDLVSSPKKLIFS